MLLDWRGWLMSMNLSDMLWCVSPSEQPGPRGRARAPPQCAWLRPAVPCAGAWWGQRSVMGTEGPGWPGLSALPADRPALLPSKLECEV